MLPHNKDGGIIALRESCDVEGGAGDCGKRQNFSIDAGALINDK